MRARLRQPIRASAARGASALIVVVVVVVLALAQPARGQPASPSPSESQRAAIPKAIDYDKVTAEATDLLSRYIKINTTNPPGNELAAAKMLREKFLAEGIPATVWIPQPNRAVIAARLHGIGKHNKSIVLLSHMDVVPAEAKEWQVPPFSGLVQDGEIWGRGALDDKGPGVVELMAMLAIKRAGILLDRDVLFLATADEEDGGRNGAGWLVEHQPDVITDAGFLLNEGGEIRAEPGKPKLYQVSVSEKTPLWLKLTAEGASGHASSPPDQTAVTRLVLALARLVEYHTPIKVLPIVEDYFRQTARIDHGPREMADLRSALHDPAFSKQFLAIPIQNASVRDTITPTVLAGSSRINVLPSAATAQLDCRLLPGDQPGTLIKTIGKLINDDHVRIDQILNFAPIASAEKTPLMSAIASLAGKRDQAAVVPMMLDGFTDSHYFRQRGLVAYGFIPLESTPELSRTIHGINERVRISNLRGGIERMVELLKIFGGRQEK
jgi:acetylornithine deacetylase/succinyl-diaminopimelate desuccinylase-like protein